MTENAIHIQVIFALPEEQRYFPVKVPKGTLASDAICASGILGWYPEIDLELHKIGIYGKQIPLNYVLDENQRIEIYRPITADPKEVRKKRIEKITELA